MNEARAGPIFLVGAGRMGSALLKGWLAQGIEPGRIFVQEPSLAGDVATLIRDAGIGTGTPPALPASPAVVVLAVKPQAMDAVLPSLAALAGRDTLIFPSRQVRPSPTSPPFRPGRRHRPRDA